MRDTKARAFESTPGQLFARRSEPAMRSTLISGAYSQMEATTVSTCQRVPWFAAALQLASAGATPMAQAMTGFLATLITGIVASALIALFVRAKPAAPPA